MNYSDFVLLAVFSIFFIAESILFSAKGTVVIYSNSLKKWKYKISDKLPYFGGKYISLRNIFPPLGVSIVCGSFPLIFSEQGFLKNPMSYKYGIADSGDLYIRYSDVREVTSSGSDLIINGKKFCLMNNESEADRWKETIMELVKSHPGNRKKKIEEVISLVFNSAEAEIKLKGILKATRFLRFLLNILYVYLFAFSPVCVYLFTLGNSAVYLLTGLLAIHLSAILMYIRAYRKSIPEKKLQWTVMISAAIFPPGLIRSIDHFFTQTFILYNPLALAFACTGKEVSEELASFLIREYSYFRFESNDKIQNEMITEFRAVMLNEIKKILKKKKMDYDSLVRPPEKSVNSVSYCPKCLCQYVNESLKCMDCNIKLIKY
ncbi:MAG: hypothetical protein JW982_07480 [Spirochaetes bacterium]|nr:hypothetical protein [Spirochaetota bacterium]